ncbi:MAG: preprotein translocase subunit SecA [Planctomycetota bacterium]|jgi:preprotein translocase subunit SecA
MPFDKVSKLLVKVFGSRNERLVKSYSFMVRQAGEYEEQMRQLDDEALSAKTAEFKSALKSGTKPQDILAEVFAVVRETARRNVDMRHFDVQLIGGKVLYEGKIAEMATGEGKTLVATLAAYMVYLTGRRVHLVTVNDYLAKRDAEWMSPVYQSLGMTVGAIQADMDTAGQERKSQYEADITYGTNNEFGFDFLRDNMKMSLDQMVQGDLEYAIIDEVDSILIDEARTPLIISGPALDDVTRYKKADQVARKLMALQSTYDRLKRQIDSAESTIAGAQGEISDAKKQKDNTRIDKAQKVIENSQHEIDSAQLRLEQATEYYEVEYDKKAAHLTHEGVGAAQEAAGVGSFFTGSNMEWPHLIEQSLRAHITFEKEKDYVVMDGKVVIVDEFTGRLMHGRQWSDGLHQAAEAKEGVQIKEESQTLATITLQNFFKLYDKIAGMTGTAATEEDEFMKIYGLDVVVMPTNKPCIRDDRDDFIFKSIPEKFKAIVEEINETSALGRPVLVGTVSVEKNEALSAALQKTYGLDHEVLNAKHHEREAQIVAKAGQQHKGRDGSMRGNVTIATNMAGRGTDIKLGTGVADIGGLHVLGTERHEARRIDNQLRGRTGRQGDKGSSQFFLCLEDDLWKFFADGMANKALTRVWAEEGMALQNRWLSKQVAKLQRKMEDRNFEIRKNLLEYDEVMDYQRKIFYSKRRNILSGTGLKQIIEEMIENAIDTSCQTVFDKTYPQKCIIEWARTNFAVDLKISDIHSTRANEIEEIIKEQAKDRLTNEISLSLGEYLEDYDDPRTWNIPALCKWAMSAFKVSLSAGKIKHQSPEEIEEQLVTAACEQIDKKDCSQLVEFLKEDFTSRTFAEWARAKFDIKLEQDQLKSSNTTDIHRQLIEQTAEKYKQREIEYPVEFAMSMLYGPEGPNVYAFEGLADWANRKFNAGYSAQRIQDVKPKILQEELLELSRSYNNGQLEKELDEKIDRLNSDELLSWANERFGTSLTEEQLKEQTDKKEALFKLGREFLRSELSDLEKYVLLQIYDSAWKDHLYTMDHLKESIWTRSFAEKDPKIEYKREGFRMFNDMLGSIEDRVTDIIFKVRLEAGARTRSVWNVSQTAHDQVGQFAMAERQRAAAQAPQGEVKAKQIKLEQPKVGRNDPCPCGSGKKYKKCHGANQ